MNKSTHDIVIVGGGIVGSVFACALAQQTSLSIAILEAHATPTPWTEGHYHHRVSAIALSSQRIFQALQVWDDMQQKRCSPFTQIQVWDGSGKGEIHFHSEEIAETVLGYIIENNLMQAALDAKIKQTPQIEYFSPIKLVAFQETENGIELVTDDGTIFKSQLVIAADGAHSWLRAKAGIQLEKWDYEQEAIVATVQTDLPHEKIARQVFNKTGPLAFLPLANANTSSIVWSLPTNEAKRLMECDVDQFKQELTHAFKDRLGDVNKVERRHTFPLRKQQAKHYVKPRVALIGDAAHTIHPLAGQGVNMGLLDATSLADVISQAVKNRRDFASLASLRRYERWRRADNFTLLSGVDVIKNIFASDKKSIQQLLSFGLNATNQMRWMKNIFTRHAVGNRRGLPVGAGRLLVDV